MLPQLFQAYSAPQTLWKEPEPENDVISVPVQHQSHPNELWSISKPCLVPHKLVLLISYCTVTQSLSEPGRAATNDNLPLGLDEVHRLSLELRQRALERGDEHVMNGEKHQVPKGNKAAAPHLVWFCFPFLSNVQSPFRRYRWDRALFCLSFLASKTKYWRI